MIKMNRQLQSAFTLIELLVVIIIFGVLATLTVVALNSARSNARDAKRVSDLKQISTALELYFVDNDTYPTSITPGAPLLSSDGSKTYMSKVPTNPTPRAEGACNDSEYQYVGTGNNYSLVGCLAKQSGSASAGALRFESSGVTRDLGPTNGLVGWWMFNEGNGARDLSGNGKHGLLNGGVSLSTGKHGESNGSYDFLADTNNYIYSNVSIPSSDVHNVGTKWTFGVWFYNKMTEHNSTYHTILTRNGQSSPVYGHWWIIACPAQVIMS